MQIKKGRYIIDKSLISNIFYNYTVWEPTQRTESGGFTHSTITTFDGVWYGRVGTRMLPPELEALEPGSDERIAAVREWHEQQYEEAYKLITEAFPEATEGVKGMGEIDLYLENHHRPMYEDAGICV